ncbi:MAG: ABC transporter ATP-binding protein, partial [Actinobacteria bacterium]|nr:ABC transporter ATP-binding protein [Actinomycetota bacterium]
QSQGLDSNETSRFGTILKNVVAEQGVGIALVEHDMSLVMDICSYIYVLDFGKLIFEGTPAEVTASQVVQTAYLGGSAELNTAKLQGGAGVL